MRALFAAIGRLLRRVVAFPFQLLGALFGGGYEPPPLDEVIAEDSEADLIAEIATVKRWCADILANRPAMPLPGRLSGWSRAICAERDIVSKIAVGAMAGRLRGHLSGKQGFQGVPPVSSFEQTREWLKARTVGRRVAAAREVALSPQAECRHPQEPHEAPDPQNAHRYERRQA